MAYQFYNAYFTNDTRNTIEVVYVNPDNDEDAYVEYLKADKSQKVYQDLLEIVTEDQLHENTYKRMKAMQEDYEKDVIAIAKDQGLIYDVDDLNSKLYEVLLKSIFIDFDAEDHKEKLFLIKIALFENEEIMNSKNKALKSKLRKAPTLLEAVNISTEIVIEARAANTPATTQAEASSDDSDSSEQQDTPVNLETLSDTSNNHTNESLDSDESSHENIDQSLDNTLTDSNLDSDPTT